jgi:hypothetical protein
MKRKPQRMRGLSPMKRNTFWRKQKLVGRWKYVKEDGDYKEK